MIIVVTVKSAMILSPALRLKRSLLGKTTIVGTVAKVLITWAVARLRRPFVALLTRMISPGADV